MDHSESEPEPIETLGNPQNGYNQPTLYIPIASPPTPVPSPGPNITHNHHLYMPNLHNHTLLTLIHPNINQDTRRHTLSILLHSLSPSDLLFVSQTITPLLKRDFLSDLPTELALHVLSFVEEPVTLCRAMRVSRSWYAMLRDESMWKRLSCAFGFSGAELMFDDRYRRKGDTTKATREHELIAPLLATSISNSSTSSSASSSSKTFSWRRYFRTSYIIRSNWRHGGTLLSSHRLPVLPSSQPTNHGHLPTTNLTSSDANGTITSLALDSDYVVIGLANSNIKVFSAKTGVLVRTLMGHGSGVWGVCLVSRGGWMELESAKKKGKRKVDGGWAGTIGRDMRRALGLEDGNDDDYPPVAEDLSDENEGSPRLDDRRNTYDAGRPSFMSYSSIGWGQPNSIIVSGGCDKVLKVWDAKSGQCIYTLSGHTATIRSLRTLHNNPIAVTGSRDATLRVWDVQRGLCLQVLEGHSQSVRCIDVCGRRVVSGSYDNTCRIWDIDSGQCLHVLMGHFHQIYSIAFDGVHVASGGLDTTVRVWDASTGVCIALLQGHTALVCQLQISASSLILVTGGSDGRVITFSLETFASLHRIAAHDSSVTALQFDDEFLVTGGGDGRVRLWDVKTGSYVREMCESSESVWKVGFGGGDARIGQGGGREVLGIMCKRNGKTAVEIWSLRPRGPGVQASKEGNLKG